jgi:GNAT superfamily N-acetyltransferase
VASVENSVTALAQPKDAERLAELHALCLPDSILSALGPRVVARYYDFVITSDLETVAVTRINGDIQAASVLSRAPASLLTRFARAHPAILATGLARGLTRSHELRRRCALRLRERGEAANLPEVVQIFTHASFRGLGLGRCLLRFTEQVLLAMGQSEYSIHTLKEKNDAGLRFYHREGFIPMGERTSFGDTYVFMKKGGF